MRKELRQCIVCNSKDASELFSYNYSYLTNVRGVRKSVLQKKGFDTNCSSTIVKCNACGCNYIKDVLIDYQIASEREKSNKLEVKKEKDVFADFSQINKGVNIEKNWRLAQLYHSLSNIINRHHGQLRVLDFGAGSAGFSRLASVIGADICLAYDLAYAENIQSVFDEICPPGLIATHDFEVVKNQGPYDIVFCQSMIEHVTNPRAIMESIYGVMATDGLLYINNPIMDLDREIKSLKSANKISKRDKLSYYHPGHLNYMTPMHFLRISKEVGFEIAPIYMEPSKSFSKNITSAIFSKVLQLCKIIIVKLVPHSKRSFYVLRK
jgi:2-polyprenyl-3-methyl-5-hydroxy-6-metoxy-1,4-benzoquinol methylase